MIMAGNLPFAKLVDGKAQRPAKWAKGLRCAQFLLALSEARGRSEAIVAPETAAGARGNGS